MSRKSADQAPITPIPVSSARRATTATLTFSLPLEVVDEIRAAVDALMGRPYYMNQSRLALDALIVHLEKLRKRHNKGKPFELAPDAPRLRRGRPITSRP